MTGSFATKTRVTIKRFQPEEPGSTRMKWPERQDGRISVSCRGTERLQLTTAAPARKLRVGFMRSGSRDRFSPWLRVNAFFVLIMWTTALVACSAHCFLGTTHLGEFSEQESCHSQTAPPPCHGGSSDDEGKSDSGALCSSLKQLFAAKVVAEVPQFAGSVLYALSARDVASLADSSSNAMHVRQAIPRDFVFTPEVYLGPALRGLAPPHLS
ncbi:MAG: hypothetical protein L0Z53_07130 [Acidobacteriales bacterium]|nr:hypothetical protein [Terriglobales bacterium]